MDTIGAVAERLRRVIRTKSYHLIPSGAWVRVPSAPLFLLRLAVPGATLPSRRRLIPVHRRVQMIPAVHSGIKVPIISAAAVSSFCTDGIARLAARE